MVGLSSLASGRRKVALIASAILLAGGLTLAFGLKAGAATGTVGPDVTVFSFTDIGNYGASGGFVGYSLGTRSCNRGDTPLNWCNNNGGCGAGTGDEDHPVIAQNLYRLKNGRFEQIGMSWLKHGFTSTNSTTAGCTSASGGSCQGPPLGGDQLGIGCTDPYTSSLNGSRPLGKKSEVNAANGDFPYPYSSPSASGPFEQRIKVAAADVDPALNAGAVYFVEGQYIANDDAAAGNSFNNASHRQVNVGASPNFALSQTGTFREREPAIFAWPQQDSTVELVEIDVPSTNPVERFNVARKVTNLGGGVWHYEYAVHNLNSDRSARSFAIQFPGATTFSNVGFHDAEYHSGEAYATTDWVSSNTADTLTWATDTFAVDPNANALRWASMFSFWFDATSGPSSSLNHSLGLFKAGSPDSVDFQIVNPIFDDGFESGDTTSWSGSAP